MNEHAAKTAIARRIRFGLLGLTAAFAIAVAGVSTAADAGTTKSASSGKRSGDTPGANARAAAPDSAEVVALLDGVTNASCPIRGIGSGGQVNPAAVKRLGHSKFRTVLDLRGTDEDRGFDEARAVKKAGLVYVSIPVTKENLDDSHFDRIRAFMQDSTNRPVMVHCSSGNRVGVMLLPWLVLDRGWSLDRALEIAKRGGTHDGPMKDKALAYIEARQPKD